jgi:hypothetical protein
MHDIFRRQTEDTLSQYTLRMKALIRFIHGQVQIEAGLSVDIDEVLADLDWIVENQDLLPDLITVHQILSAWSDGRVGTKQAMELAEVSFDELVHAALDNGVALPKVFR